MENGGRARVRIPLGQRFADLWLFGSDDEYLLFDTGVKGTLASHLLPALKALSIEPSSLRHVVVSHLDVDHSGDVGNVRKHLPRASVVGHDSDSDAMEKWETFVTARGREFRDGWGLDEDPSAVDWMESVFAPGKIDQRLEGSTTWPFVAGRALEVWHVPGHTLGHLAVWDPDYNTLAISDAILGGSVPLADGSPSFPPTYRHVDDYLATIERVRAQRPETLLTAHYGDYVGDDVIHFLDESESFVATLDTAVQDCVSQGQKTLKEIVAEVNPRVASWPVAGTDTALAFPVSGHLERLWNSGVVNRQPGPAGWRWSQ